jgi:hypothetical protein
MEKWLRCKVLPGMFSHEWLVVIEEPGHGEITSIFVDTTLVRTLGEPRRGHPVAGELLVRASRSGDRADVSLPVQSPEHGWVVSVPADLLVG